MAEGADVTISYEFLPTERSIRESAEKVANQLNKKLGGVGGGETLNKRMKESTKKLTSEYESTFDLVINLLRATQEKTSLQTKLSAAEKVKSRIFGGGGGEAGGAMAGGVGAGGGVLAALGTIAAILVVIAIAIALISAFIDAVGPIIKVVLKMISAMILILLMPFLKRGLPLLFGILKWMIIGAKAISDFVDGFFTHMEKLVEKAMGGDPMAWLELFIGPIGMLVIFLGKKIIEFLKQVDWAAVANTIITGLEKAFIVGKNIIKEFITQMFGAEIWEKVVLAVQLIRNVLAPEGLWEQIGNAINYIGTTIFGEGVWTGIKEAIDFIGKAIFEEGLWESIKKAVDYIGTEVFGEGVWEDIKTAIVEVNNLINNEWSNIISTLQDIGTRLNSALAFIIDPTGTIRAIVKDIIGGLFSGNEQQDFISRPGGGIVPFSPNDTIIGTKNPGALGGVNITNNLNVSAGVDKSEFRKILAELNRQQARELRTKTSYSGGVFA